MADFMDGSFEGLQLAHAFLNGDPFFLIVGVSVCAAFNGFKINGKGRHPFQGFQKERVILYVPGQFIYAQCGEFLALGLGDIIDIAYAKLWYLDLHRFHDRVAVWRKQRFVGVRVSFLLFLLDFNFLWNHDSNSFFLCFYMAADLFVIAPRIIAPY